jgi:hypothetical protein
MGQFWKTMSMVSVNGPVLIYMAILYSIQAILKSISAVCIVSAGCCALSFFCLCVYCLDCTGNVGGCEGGYTKGVGGTAERFQTLLHALNNKATDCEWNAKCTGEEENQSGANDIQPCDTRYIYSDSWNDEIFGTLEIARYTTLRSIVLLIAMIPYELSWLQ